MILFSLGFLAFGLWAVSWGVWACYRRPKPHDLLGAATAVLGLAGLGLGAALMLQPGFFG